jgi:hypothetical protein
MKVINANENLGGFALKKNKENVDKTTNGTVTSPGKIEVTEVNMPSSQAIKNFSIKLIEIKEKLHSEVKVSA